jgi:hypothetical protein
MIRSILAVLSAACLAVGPAAPGALALTASSGARPTLKTASLKEILVQGLPQVGGTVCGGVVDGKLQKPCSPEPAKFESDAVVACPQGSFLDIGLGSCWSCPAGFARTILYPVTGPKACRRKEEFSPAAAGEKKGCPEGQIYSPFSSKNADVASRIRAQAGGALPEGVRSSDGGTCWSCPPGDARSLSMIWASDACDPGLIDWRPASYPEPGLFGLDGGEETALALVRDRKLIDEIAASLVPELAPTADEARRKVWAGIAAKPQNSAVLKLAVLARVEAALADPGHATDAERRLAASFAAAVTKFDVFVAQNALDAYDAWKKASDFRKKNQAGSLTTLFDYGTPPPDFQKIAAATVMEGLGAAGAGDAAVAFMFVSKKVSRGIFPYRKFSRAKQGAKASEDVIEAAKDARRAASGAMDAVDFAGLSASIGPEIIVTFAVEMIALSAQQVADIQTARPKLEAALSAAKKTADLGAMLKNDDSGLEGYWSSATGAAAPPANPGAFAAAK